MVYILGKNISNKKNIVYGLTTIYGIGLKTAQLLCNKTGLSTTISMGFLSENDIVKITNYIQDNLLVENFLRSEISSNIKSLISIRNYRGIRHNLSLPVRGQRTSCNAKTQRFLGKSRFK